MVAEDDGDVFTKKGRVILSLAGWHILSVSQLKGLEVHLHLCQCVAGGVLGQAVAAVLFQSREEGSCFCRGWILSMQHSAGRSPEEEGVGRRESKVP